MSIIVNSGFSQYHADNPAVYDLILMFSRQAKAAGHHRYSMRAIMHRIRWHLNVDTNDPDGFKINNNYSQDYSMKVMDEHPEFLGFFKLRF